MTYRLDRLAWARAVLSDMHWWVYDGIDRPKPDRRRRSIYSTKTAFVYTVFTDDHYLDARRNEEIAYYIKDNIYYDEWEAYCKDKAHRARYCPHSGDPEEQAAYYANLTTMLKDQGKYWEFVAERFFDWDSLTDAEDDYLSTEEGVAQFLKEHPVIGVMVGSDDQGWEYIDLAEVVFFCPDCDTPNTDADQKRRDAEDGLVWFECRGCRDEISVFDLRAAEKPATWPPGAPFPPRQHFDGTPLDVPPDED